MSRKIASHYALINGQLRRNIILEVDDSGCIVSISEAETLDNRCGVEFYSGILIAGMVNAHCHLELSYLRGAIAEQTGFAGFAREIGLVRGNYTDEERIRAASVADARMWEEGIQAVADITNDSLIMEVKRHSKIAYHTLYEVFGLTTDSIDRHRAMASEPNTSITPHSTYSVQDNIFREIAAEGTAPLSIHFLESDDEAALYRHEGSLNAWYERMGWQCDFLKYGMPAERIVESIPANRRLMLVHNCKASHLDVMMMDAHFEHDVTWVLCPESNRYISGIKPPVQMLRSMGAHIALGTDSLASARTLSMIDNMRLLEGVPLVDMLCWATEGGARALGMESTLGRLEVGLRPGIVLLEGVDLQTMTLTQATTSRRLI